MKNVTENEALRLVLAGTAGETGVPFFRALARSLSEALGTMAAMVTEYRPADRRLKALAFLVKGEFIEGYEYLVEGTPCAVALERRGVLQFRERLPDFFPNDGDLIELGFVSYLGCPLLDEDGETLGLLAVLDNKPMPGEGRFISLFELFAARASAEHRRLRQERELQARHEARGLAESAADALIELDAAWHIRKANRAAERIFRCTAEDLVGEAISEYLQPASMRFLLVAARELSGAEERGVWLPAAIAAQRWDHTPFSAEATLSRFEHHGDISYVLVLRDVGERSAALAALQESGTEENDAIEEGTIIGRSDAMKRLKRALAQVAATDATVLVLGETGTGKELVAREIHAASRRREKPLVRVNCAAIPQNLIESEFFGHEKGAFTGATSRREGRFASADGGSLFLDEVGELPLDLQAKLLRVLQEGEFEPVGSDRTKRVDVRLIAATNRDLADAVRAGRFREDLFYRLNVFPLNIPPLRERGDDVCRLAESFLVRFSRAHGRPVPTVPPEEARALRAHGWPGNVRELQNTIERALILAGRDGAPAIAQALGISAAPASAVTASPTSDGAAPKIFTAAELQQMERENLIRALDHCGGKISGLAGAAALLGIPPSTFSSRMKALGIERRG
jgi:PAS domain S-box-containing protein